MAVVDDQNLPLLGSTKHWTYGFKLPDPVASFMGYLMVTTMTTAATAAALYTSSTKAPP